MANPSHSGETKKPPVKKACDDLNKQMTPRNPDHSKLFSCPDIFPATESAEDIAKRKELENIKTINKQPKE